jgi:polysaccharide pyruvyl transferase WcaK-like protein
MARRRRVLFVVGYGGNAGNNASLHVALRHVRCLSPDALVRVLCWNPEAALREADVNEAFATYRAQRAGLVGKLVTKCAELLLYARLVARSDVVIYPGTGALEGEMGFRRFAEPFVMAVVAIVCRLTGRPFLVLGMGVSAPPPGLRRFSGWTTLRLARRLSFRDELSRRYAAEWGVNRRDTTVGADLVLAEDVQVTSQPGDRSVALGVMVGHGTATGADDVNITLWSDIARRLVDRQCRVELFMGNLMDLEIATQVADRVASDLVTVNRSATVPDIVTAMERVDVVVAARYHNVVCGILAGRPTMALSYAEKSLDLVERAGSGPGHLLAAADAQTIYEDVEALLAGVGTGRDAMLVRRQELHRGAVRLLAAIDEFM